MAAVPSPCDSAADCSGNEICNQYDFSGTPFEGRFWGVCICAWGYGFSNPPACDRLTDKSVWAVINAILLVVVYSVSFLHATRTLRRVLSLKRRGAALSTSALAWLSSALLLTVWSSELAFTQGSHHSGHIPLRSVCLTLGMAALVTAALSVSLMWIEFVIATERMQKFSGTLKRTRNFLIGHLICYLVASAVPLTILQTKQDYSGAQNAYLSMFVSGVIISATLVLITFTLGAIQISSVFLKAEATFVARADRLAGSVLDRPSGTQLDQEEEEHRRLASIMRSKAWLIITTARRVQVGLVFVVAFGVPWCIFVAMPEDLTELLLWSLTFFLNLGLAIATTAISQFLYLEASPNPYPTPQTTKKVSPAEMELA